MEVPRSGSGAGGSGGIYFHVAGSKALHEDRNHVAMHELSIALSIIDGVMDESRQRGDAKVEAVHLRLGPYSGIEREALEFSYGVACAGTPLEGSRLIIEGIPLAVFCSKCKAERQPVSATQLMCSECGSWTPEIVRGKELEIYALELAA